MADPPVSDSRPEVAIPGTDYLLLDSLQELMDAAIAWRETWIFQRPDGQRAVYANNGTAQEAERVLLLAAAKYAEDVRDNIAEMKANEDHG